MYIYCYHDNRIAIMTSHLIDQQGGVCESPLLFLYTHIYACTYIYIYIHIHAQGTHKYTHLYVQVYLYIQISRLWWCSSWRPHHSCPCKDDASCLWRSYQTEIASWSGARMLLAAVFAQGDTQRAVSFVCAIPHYGT